MRCFASRLTTAVRSNSGVSKHRFLNVSAPKRAFFGTLSHGEPFSWDSDVHWKDPLLLDSQLTEEETLIQEAARKFTEDSLRPRVTEHFRKEEGPTREIIREMGEAGLLGVVLPEEYGGAGASATAYGLVAREVEKCDSGYRSTMSVQSSLVMWPIYCFGTEEQKMRFLPRLAKGEIVFRV